MIGYEFEFLVREGNRPLSRAKFLEFHTLLKAEGWEEKFDPDTKGLVGSKKDGVYITSDDGTGVLEINLPPTETVTESHERMSALLHKLQTKFRNLGCSIIGTSVFPGEFQVSSTRCADACTHPDCCDKSVIKFLMAQRFGETHHHWFVIAANHIWLDVPKNDIARQLYVFNRLPAVVYALFANGPIWQQQESGLLDWRDKGWHIPLSQSSIPEDKTIYGFFTVEHTSTFDYFDALMKRPPYFAFRSGISFKPADPHTTMRDLICNPSTPSVWGHGGSFVSKPTLEDVFELQHTSFPHARLKFFLRDGVTLEEFTDAYRNKNEIDLLNCFSKCCIEVRSVGAQRRDDISIAPALMLGIQENVSKTKALVDKYSYVFWKGLHDAVQKDGLRAVHEEIAVIDIAKELVAVAEEGLRTRAEGEEVLLADLNRRINQQMNPAQELLEIFRKGGVEAVYAARDF